MQVHAAVFEHDVKIFEEAAAAGACGSGGCLGSRRWRCISRLKNVKDLKIIELRD
jgi:hypothetical protein